LEFNCRDKSTIFRQFYPDHFGSFYNPPGFAPETGFYQGASARVGEMLRFRDVSKPAAQAQTGTTATQGTTP